METRREVLGDGRVMYVGKTDLIDPGMEFVACLGVEFPSPFTPGFPGLPETRGYLFGVERPFLAQEIYLSDGFSLRDLSTRSSGDLRLPIARGTEIPATALREVGRGQPCYGTVGWSDQIYVTVKNKGSESAACEVSVIGKEIKSSKNLFPGTEATPSIEKAIREGRAEIGPLSALDG